MYLKDKFESPIILPPLWKTIEKIQDTLGISNSVMASLMSLKEKEYLRFKRINRDPSVTSAFSLCESLNLGFESLMEGQLDYKAVFNQYFGNKYYLPEKYSIAANSKRRTVINLLNFIEKRFGESKRFLALRNFQMTEKMFENPDELINLRFSTDISQWILNYYMDENILVEMGHNSALLNRKSDLGKELSIAKNNKELFELMFNEVLEKYIEKNFKWKLVRLNSVHGRLEGYPNLELVPQLGRDYMFNRVGCLIRKGFIESMPCYIYNPAISVKKVACVNQSDGYCGYEFHLNNRVLN